MTGAAGAAAAPLPETTRERLAPALDGADGTVLVAMSGGVDSSVTAALLHRAGWRVVGATIKTFCYSEVDGPSNTCCGLEGIADAKAVAGRLGFPHFVYDAEEAFAEDVVEDFVSEYAAGRTPIPCVRCNSFTKFRDLLGRADELGCDRMATGHYARVRRNGDGARLCRAEDDAKDQTYFLWGIPRRALDRLVLPVGEVEKPEVRATARELDLTVADKPESFEICFVPDNDYRGVLRRHLGADHPALSPGPFLLEDGREVGRHEGYADFTVGQRRGLPGGFDEPMYVLEIRPEDRAVVIGPREGLDASEVEAGKANWLAPRPEPGRRVGVRVRHGAPVVDAVVREADADRFRVETAVDQRAVTPGQSAVLYGEEEGYGGGAELPVVLGGGVIV